MTDRYKEAIQGARDCVERNKDGGVYLPDLLRIIDNQQSEKEAMITHIECLKTDKEIIKYFNLCLKCDNGCKDCGFKGEVCDGSLQGKIKTLKMVIDLINRQQAEIERLQKHSKKVLETCSRVTKANDERNNEMFQGAIEVVRAEAIKEFAERLKRLKQMPLITTVDIDNLVKEMVGEQG